MEDIMNPKISVIVSAYNIQQYISECVDSILKQTYPAYEIILVNDGSTDQTLAICEQYENAYDNVKVVNKKNSGLSSARNAGIKASGGGYCYFVDGDDYILPNTLRSFVDILNSYGTLDFIHGRMSYFTDGEFYLRKQPLYIDNSWEKMPVSGQCLFIDAFKYQSFLAMGVRGLYRKDFLLENNLFFVEKKISWPEDEEWTPRVFFYAKKAAGNEKAYYCYRENRVGSETTKLGNLEAAKLCIDIYSGWYTMADYPEIENREFSKYLIQEAGRRYLWAISKYSKHLCEKDMKSFLEYESNKDYLVRNARGLSKRHLFLKYMCQLLGVKKAAEIYRSIIVTVQSAHKLT